MFWGAVTRDFKGACLEFAGVCRYLGEDLPSGGQLPEPSEVFVPLHTFVKDFEAIHQKVGLPVRAALPPPRFPATQGTLYRTPRPPLPCQLVLAPDLVPGVTGALAAERENRCR
jgi:hypothetical protein